MGDTSETNTKFCPENCFCCGSTKNAYTEKSLFARHGPFSQVLSHNYILHGYSEILVIVLVFSLKAILNF